MWVRVRVRVRCDDKARYLKYPPCALQHLRRCTRTISNSRSLEMLIHWVTRRGGRVCVPVCAHVWMRLVRVCFCVVFVCVCAVRVRSGNLQTVAMFYSSEGQRAKSIRMSWRSDCISARFASDCTSASRYSQDSTPSVCKIRESPGELRHQSLTSQYHPRSS